MFDEELAASMAKGEGIGITQWLVSQLEDRGGSKQLNKGSGLTEYLQSSQTQ
jgi:Rod binding domain-containing protein